MDTTGLRTIISKRFGEQVVDVRPDIFKVTGRFNKKQFATYYFDCSDSFMNADFDMMDYQKGLLATDYYQSAGPLQWSFYLYFVTDNQNISKEVKAQIESNKAFTRKLITSSEELIKIIEVQSKLKEQPKVKLDQALISVWKSKLKSVGLSGIYSTKDYPKIADVFQLYIDNTPFKEVIDEERPVSSAEIQTSIISALDLEGFRSFSDAERFSFKKVNLIKGVNGTGKTSILEGIELCICGQTIENSSKREPAKKLELIYDTGDLDKYSPDDTKKFQARDRSWFGNNTLRGNTLSQGFHVYNFFDSDAAYRFTMESNTGEAVQQIFSRIILGEQTNLIFDRIERFSDKLANQIKQLSLQYKQKSDERLLYQVKLNEVDSSSQVISTLGEIIRLLDELKWSGVDLLLSEGANRQQFQSQFAKVSAFFTSILGITWIDPFYITGIIQEQEHLVRLIKELEDSIAASKLLRGQIQDIATAKEIIENQITILRASEKYFDEPEIQALGGLQSKLDRSRTNSALIERIKSICLNFQGSKNVAIANLLDSTTRELALARRELIELATESDSIKRNVSTLNQLKADLKRIGTEYVQASHETDNCPLCNTKFPDGKLLSIIDSLELQIKESEALSQVALKHQGKSKLAAQLEQDLQLLKTLEQEFSHANDLSIPNYRAVSIQDLSQKLDEISKSFEDEWIRLDVIGKRLSDIGINERDLASHNSTLKAAGLDLTIGTTSQEKYSEKTTELLSSRTETENRQVILKTSLNELEGRIDKVVFDYLSIPSQGILNSIEILKGRLDKLKMSERLYDDMKSIITVPENEALKNLHAKVKVIEDLLAKYLQIENQNKLRNEFQQQLDALKSGIAEIDETKGRLNKAKAVLDEIISVNNRENYLREFFVENKQAILDVFRVIHLPNEFDDIQFESSDAIKLKVKNGTELRDLSEISTGQKSAFILSLFLTLNNNLQSGPPLIIFDDPIAYVDDINTLSFLDFLRDRAIMTNRQIFFATANSKLANLFQQKFDFLGDDLKVINLNSESFSN